MPTILGISGSLRRDSLNTKLLRAAMELVPEGSTLETGTIAGIPLYDGDLEAEHGSPPAVQALKDRIVACDALLLVTPEYNHSIPGVLKNAIDWLSRPSSDVRRVFGGRVVGVIGASAGPGGTGLSQVAWLPVLRTLGTVPWFGERVQVGPGASVFDAEGKLVDPVTHERLERYVHGFVDFARRMSPGEQ